MWSGHLVHHSQAETEAPVYGVLHRPEANTTFRRSLGGYPELAADMRQAGSPRRALALAFGPPT